MKNVYDKAEEAAMEYAKYIKMIPSEYEVGDFVFDKDDVESGPGVIIGKRLVFRDGIMSQENAFWNYKVFYSDVHVYTRTNTLSEDSVIDIKHFKTFVDGAFSKSKMEMERRYNELDSLFERINQEQEYKEEKK